MPGGAQEVAAGVPYQVGPMDHGMEFGFSKCNGKPLEDFFGGKITVDMCFSRITLATE